jgi:long-chain acyl-CoA synthetase
MSIKRNVIVKDFAAAVDEIYNVPVTTTDVPLP